jgi:hypothetical protein
MLCGRILNVSTVRVHCKLKCLSFTVYISGQIFLVLEQVTSILQEFFFMTWHSYWARASSLLRLHDHTQFDTPHSVGLFWTNDRPVAGDLYLTTHNTHNRQISMPPAEFEPAKASERPQTHWLEPVDNGVCITGTAQYEFQVRVQG